MQAVLTLTNAGEAIRVYDAAETRFQVKLTSSTHPTPFCTFPKAKAG